MAIYSFNDQVQTFRDELNTMFRVPRPLHLVYFDSVSAREDISRYFDVKMLTLVAHCHNKN